MTDVKVTITEIDNEAWRDQEFPEFDETTCDVRWACAGQPIGGYLTIDRETDQDVPTFRIYYELTTEYNGTETVERSCEDCFGYISQFAPAIVAFNAPPERQ